MTPQDIDDVAPLDNYGRTLSRARTDCASVSPANVPRLALAARDAGGMHFDFEDIMRRAARYASSAGKPRPWGAIEFRRRDQRRAWHKTGGRCFYCGMQVLGPGVGMWSETHQCYGTMRSPFATWLQVDHRLSRKLGGRSNRDNLFPACPECNQLKRGHPIGQFRKLFAAKHGSPFFYGEIAS